MRPMFEEARKLFGTRPVIGVEVGTSSGVNALEVLGEWKELTKLVCVDSYPVYSDFSTELAQRCLLFCAIGNFIPNPRAYLRIKDSVAAANDFSDGSLDFVYIDANHSYQFVKRDIDAWCPKVRKGGIIGGHDFDWMDAAYGYEYAVKRAVVEVFNGKTHYHQSLFTPECISTKDGLYTGDNSDWWVFL